MSIIKYAKNPILTKHNVPFKVNSIFNAGATKYKNKYLLLCRVEMPDGRSSFVLAESRNGIEYSISDKPCLTPADHNEWYPYVEWGIEDPRICHIGDEYIITYTGYSKYEPLVILAKTNNFKKFEILGPVSEPSNKDSAVFPEKINGYYWKLDRPSAEGQHQIWINKSPDLVHWGENRHVLSAEPGSWEQTKIGNSSNPVRTDNGWLVLYHGVRGFGISSLYKLGVMLLDLEKPWIVKGKSREPILSPDHGYERVGDVGNVVFSNGWIIEDNGEVKIYYSGADTNICLATTSVNYLLSLCE